MRTEVLKLHAMLDDAASFKPLVYTVIEIAKSYNENVIYEVLSQGEVTIQQTDYDNWNGGTYIYTIFVTVDVKIFVGLANQVDGIERRIDELFGLATRDLQHERLSKITLVPKSNSLPETIANPHRPFSQIESQRKKDLLQYLAQCSEDNLIEQILLPLFRQLGFFKITPTGHKDKALEYGKDIWMKYTLPTQHILYFGIQVKKGKLDASGISKNGNNNISEILNQLLMMIGHEIFDPEVNRKVLVDHAFIVAGGEITKAAKNWLGEKLDKAKRSQVMFMDRDIILDLFVVTNLPLPTQAVKKIEPLDELPF